MPGQTRSVAEMRSSEAAQLRHEPMNAFTTDPKTSCCVSNPAHATCKFVYTLGAPNPATGGVQFEVGLLPLVELAAGDPVLLLGVFGTQEPLCYPADGNGEVYKLRDFTGPPTGEDLQNRREKLAFVAGLLRAHGNDAEAAEASLVAHEREAAAMVVAQQQQQQQQPAQPEQLQKSSG